MKASAPGLIVAGVSHLASAESRRAYLTIATDRSVHSLTNETSNGVISVARKGHNEIGAVLEAVGLAILGKDASQSEDVQVEVVATAESAPAQSSSIADKLRELANLHRDGILTDSEFADARAAFSAPCEAGSVPAP